MDNILRPESKSDETISIAEVAAELALTSRPEAASDDEEGDGADSDSHGSDAEEADD